jgi:peptidoglycan/LPS O-acetylase OafA/YrhL
LTALIDLGTVVGGGPAWPSGEAQALNSRLGTLDAMRGVAAVLVMFWHFATFMPTLAGSGQLAVDFFFVLSGFVISRAYGARLASGLGFWGFMCERVIRLYPLFVLGLSLALVKEFGDILFGRAAALTPLMLLRTVGLEAAMLPAYVPGQPELFPLNGPSWSLFFEMAINIIFALAALQVTVRRLLIVIVVMGTAVAAAAISAGSLNVGWSWSSAWAGVARVGFSFPLGVLVHRLGWVRSRGPSPWFAVPVGLLVAALALPVASAWRPAFDAGFVLILSPLLLIAGGSYDPPRALQQLCAKLGELSYPLYATHFPLIFVFGFVATRLGIPAPGWIAALAIALPILALVLSRIYDAPVRAWLSRRWIADRRRDAPSPA